MTQAVPYIALKPLSVQMPDGERRVLQPGDLIPEEIHGRWLWMAQEAGKVGVGEVKVASPSRRKSAAA